MPRTIAARTRRVYDLVSSVYPASTYFFHSKAHDCALKHSGIRNGMRVLEVATGSGEMFRRLVKANPDGRTYGLDLSPNMAAHTLRVARKACPRAEAHCGAVDVRNLSLPLRQLRCGDVLLPAGIVIAGRYPAHAAGDSPRTAARRKVFIGSDRAERENVQPPVHRGRQFGAGLLGREPWWKAVSPS